ncbi:MAG: MFS transporter [Thermoguttaceae bacterium]|jgi:nucleoside transporter|nr:MFS transporter [Thermoguttaceae bacterium]
MATETVSTAASPTGSSPALLSRLSVMMFLQYFVQGAYLPVASVYVMRSLGFSSLEVGIFSAALSVGPIVAPFIVGQLVDRLFATERVMAFCHLVGGALMLVLFAQTKVWPVILLGTLYSVLYVPTMMLANSLAFRHLKNSNLEFPWVRLFGTLGFIVPAYLVEFWWLYGLEGSELDRARGIVFALSGIAGIVMAGYCLTLPPTPPQQHEERKYAPGAVIAMLRRRDFLVLVVVSFFISIAHQFFFVWNSPFLRAILDTGGWGAKEQSIASIGQICELGVLAALGLVLKRLGFKWTLVVGAAAYMVRCLLFAVVFSLDPPFAGKLILAGAGQAMHGLCFGCFLAVGYMYVDRIAPPDIRGSMQTLYGTFILALGFFVGGFVGGQVGEWFILVPGDNPIYDWTGIWLSCAALCAVCVAAFAVLFPKDTRPASGT